MSFKPLETVLSTLSGSNERERVLVVLLQEAGHGSRLELRQQSFGDGVGWFTQSSVALEPQQVAELRGVLGTGANGKGTSAHLPKAFSRTGIARFPVRVVHADSA